jgi:sugar phosphate isomerase/epimerase
MNNLYVSTTFIKDGKKIKMALDILKSAGVENVEIGSSHAYESNYNYIKNYKFNFLIHNYFPVPKKDFVINIASLSKKIRERSINQIKRSIEFYKKINAKIYTFHPGFIGDPLRANRNKKNYDFLWKKKNIKDQYLLAYNQMILSLKKIVNFAKKKDVKIAIETEGSFKKRNFLLLQRPEEYKNLFKFFSPKDIGINLNIGHLNLASNAFSFSKSKFVDMLKPYIVAIELSHNNGIEDQHLPLKKNQWYWKIINDPDFFKVYKILEFRNTSIKNIKNTLNLLNK